MKSLTYLITFLIVTVAGTAGYLYWKNVLGNPASSPIFVEHSNKPIADRIIKGEVTPPVYSPDKIESINSAESFSTLVSYTDKGFEPAEFTVHKGDTVRFTNNSSRQLWVLYEESGSKKYPRSENACGETDFDSCGFFKPQDFWQITFTKDGTWNFLNNVNKSDTGTVHVLPAK